jgi:phospholipase C
MPDPTDHDPTDHDATDQPETDRSPLISRRHLIGAAAAGASALALSGTQIGRAAAATVPVRQVPRNPGDSGIDHVVVVMMENRSFDHILGWLPGSRSQQKGLTYVDGGGVAHKTWHLDTFDGLQFHDPDHSYNGGRTEFNAGACDGWLRAGSNDIFSIGYYTKNDLSFYGHAAPYWTVCDRFFAPFMGPTFPNRFYMHSAQTDRQSNLFLVNGLPAQMPTIWDSLAAKGLRGRYYYSDFPFTALWGGTLAGISSPLADFLTACDDGTLPEVSFVDPRFTNGGTLPQGDDHPHADIRVGQFFLNSIYEAVSASPNWANTVMVITYDEWGGFFDHVPPGVAPDVNPANAQRGFRIPAIVISPRARRNHVDHRVYDTSSILKMIEWRWGLPALTPRDAAARNLAEVLDFQHAPDLTAPRWTVPEVGTFERTPSKVGPLASPATLAAQRADHAAEWAEMGNLAQHHGFAV